MSTLKKGLDYDGKVIKSIYPNKGIVECEGEKITVKNVLEGQKVSFRLSKVRNGRHEGKLIDVIERSPIETQEPFCPHFEFCGGCTYQRLSYEDLLNMKADQVKTILDEAINGQYDYEFSHMLRSPFNIKADMLRAQSCLQNTVPTSLPSTTITWGRKR